MSDYVIRHAGIDDAPVIARHRVAMFHDMGQVPTEAMAAELLELSLPALGAALRDGSYVGWLAVAPTGEIVAGAGVHIKPQLPRPAPDHATIAAGPVPEAFRVSVSAWSEPKTIRSSVPEPPPESTMSITAVLPVAFVIT